MSGGDRTDRDGGPLLDALEARTGIVCLVGAGGKKSTLYRLASAHPGRVGLTASVHSARFPRAVAAHRILCEPDVLRARVVQAAADHRVVAFGRPSKTRARVAGFAPELLEDVYRAAGFDVLLVKADGARSRWIKAPNPDEPVIPESATTVIPVVSARVIGEPLTERVAHRLERLVQVMDAEPGEPVRPEHVARLLTHEHGALQHVGDATVVPLLNMVDDDERERLAREAAERALGRSDAFERIVLASMRSPDALVAVVQRR